MIKFTSRVFHVDIILRPISKCSLLFMSWKLFNNKIPLLENRNVIIQSNEDLL